jgi:hypothetical protein
MHSEPRLRAQLTAAPNHLGSRLSRSRWSSPASALAARGLRRAAVLSSEVRSLRSRAAVSRASDRRA